MKATSILSDRDFHVDWYNISSHRGMLFFLDSFLLLQSVNLQSLWEFKTVSWWSYCISDKVLHSWCLLMSSESKEKEPSDAHLNLVSTTSFKYEVMSYSTGLMVFGHPKGQGKTAWLGCRFTYNEGPNRLVSQDFQCDLSVPNKNIQNSNSISFIYKF